MVEKWVRLPAVVQSELKDNLLHMIISETEASIQHATARIISVIAKCELAAEKWPELLLFMSTQCVSGDDRMREIGSYVLSSVIESATSALASSLPDLFALLGQGLQDRLLIVAVHSAQSVAAVVPALESSADVQQFRALIPLLLATFQRCFAEGEVDLLSNVVDVFTEAAENQSPLLSQHMPDIVTLLLGIGLNADADVEAREKCFAVLAVLVTECAKVIARKRLLATIVEACARVLSEKVCC